MDSNENKISYRWRERALIAMQVLKSCEARTQAGQRLAESPG